MRKLPNDPIAVKLTH